MDQDILRGRTEMLVLSDFIIPIADIEFITSRSAGFNQPRLTTIQMKKGSQITSLDPFQSVREFFNTRSFQ